MEGVYMAMYTFEEYLSEPKSIDFDEMQSLHSDMLSEIGRDADAVDLYEELLDAARKYAEIRALWTGLSREEKMDIDPLRTSHHDSLIIHFNMLARCLRMQGKKAAWRDQLGYEEDDRFNRKAIGDFGCYIVFVNSLCAR